MLLREIKQSVTQLLKKMVFFALKQISKSDWEKLQNAPRENRPLPIGRQELSVYKANNEKGLESLMQQGFRSDITSQNRGSFLEREERVDLPRWAREIEPFLQNQLSVHTRRAYETDLKHFFFFLEGRISPDDLKTLRPEHIILYRKFLEEGRLTGAMMEKSTINRKLATVKSFLNWLRANSILKENPAELVKGYPQSQESSLKGLSDEEVVKILNLPNRNSRAGSLHGAVLHFLLYTGVRKSELIGLKMGDIDQERGVPVVKVRGKGHRVRILPLTERVRLHLEHYFRVCGRNKKEMEEPLFTPTKNPRFGILTKPLNPHAITYIVSHYAKKAGILKPISPHSCRATCISHALDKKATHRSVQHLAGWSTPLMIQRYDKRREDLKNSAAYLVDYGEENQVPAQSN